ncbi:hypothetical protein G7Y89_g1774 [Cudoniella acicularis]|uniref:Uncharacterized protein n=1 Tax=Cudoniella acicularis TaxID=354080 RepID=A0A8H4W9Y5_9HELO|nr:hypothetical protein G7Y89_g1774 [Cudoniella acicularis]
MASVPNSYPLVGYSNPPSRPPPPPTNAAPALRRFIREKSDTHRIQSATLKEVTPLAGLKPAQHRIAVEGQKEVLAKADLLLYHKEMLSLNDRPSLAEEKCGWVTADQILAPSSSAAELRSHPPQTSSLANRVASRSNTGFLQSIDEMESFERQYSLHLRGSPARPPPINISGPHRAIRYATAPVLPSQKKENVPPNPVALMRPISPAQNRAAHLPKSRTLTTMQKLTSSFSRSNLNLASTNNSRKSSASSAAPSHHGLSLSTSKSSTSLSTAFPTTAVSDITAEAIRQSMPASALPIFSDHTYIHSVLPSQMWAGRLSALYDRFSTEMVQGTLTDPKIYQKCVAPTPKGFIPPPRPSEKKAKSKDQPAKMASRYDSLDTERLQSSLYLEDDSDKRYIKAFDHLRNLCMTDEARKSLWEFQLQYARTQNNPRLLPVGGSMKDGWISRLATSMGNDRKPETGTSMGTGRRTGFSRFGKSRTDLSGTLR